MYPSRPVTQILACIYFPLLVAVLGELLARIASVYMDRRERQCEQQFLSRTLTINDITKMDTDKSGEVDKAGALVKLMSSCAALVTSSSRPYHGLLFSVHPRFFVLPPYCCCQNSSRTCSLICKKFLKRTWTRLSTSFTSWTGLETEL